MPKGEFKLLSDLSDFVLENERENAQEIVRQNQDLVRADRAAAKEELAGSEDVEKQKEGGLEAWSQGFLKKFEGFAQLGNSIANVIAGAFQTFIESTASGQVSLVDAIKNLAKSLLKGVISSIGDALITKAAVYLIMALALLAGILTAPASTNYFLAAGYLTAAGFALKVIAANFLAEGALVVRPTLAVIGEGPGPEVVIPEDRFAEFGLGGGLDIAKLKVDLPDMTSFAEARNPELRSAIISEVLAGYRLANAKAV